MAQTGNQRGAAPAVGDDLALARAAAAGDRRAQSAIAERMYDRVRAAVRYLGGGHRDEDDFVQLALAEILASCWSYKGESALETWANRIAVRKTMKLLKQRKSRDLAVQLDPDAAPRGPIPREGEDHRFMMRRKLAEIFGALPLKYRAVLVPRLVLGYGTDEIVSMTGTPRGTVRQRLRRGRKMLMKAVAVEPVFADWMRARRDDEH